MLTYLIIMILIALVVDLVTDRPYYPGGSGLRTQLLKRLKKIK